MRTQLLSLLLPLLLLMVPVCEARQTPEEDFAAFLDRFVTDEAFRLCRIVIPLRTVLGNPTDERIKETWSLAEVNEKLPIPVPSGRLQSQGMEQQIDRSRRTVVVTQARSQSDSLILIYRFKQENGKWVLTSFEDSSY